MINHSAIDNAHIERLKKEDTMLNQVYDHEILKTEDASSHDDSDVQLRNNLIS